MDKDSAVRELIKGLKRCMPLKLEDGTITGREIAETVHTMNKKGDLKGKSAFGLM